MKKLYFYFHAGSGNHGCEAIVRSTARLLNVTPTLVSNNVQEDEAYKIVGVAKVVSSKGGKTSVFDRVLLHINRLFDKTERMGYHVRAKNEVKKFDAGSIALSIGGDNYCYGEAYNYYLEGYNISLHKKNIKTVLWGCSIEPSTVTEEMIRDFATYELIVARESISYEVLKKANPNTLLTCDPAFLLEKEELSLPKQFIPEQTVGINISPLIQKSETIEGITIENYRNMIRHILDNTTYNIALIPHVVSEGNDDRVPLKRLYDEFYTSDRVCLIGDCNCMQLKGYISRCCLFVGARTHATIAAYSTCVPTLVIGYSTKATGIAADLFGTSENYVLPVQQLKTVDDMKHAFNWLDANKTVIKLKLYEVLPSYVQSIEKAKIALENM